MGILLLVMGHQIKGRITVCVGLPMGQWAETNWTLHKLPFKTIITQAMLLLLFS
jgi:hypothetical protein